MNSTDPTCPASVTVTTEAVAIHTRWGQIDWEVEHIDGRVTGVVSGRLAHRNRLLTVSLSRLVVVDGEVSFEEEWAPRITKYVSRSGHGYRSTVEVSTSERAWSEIREAILAGAAAVIAHPDFPEALAASDRRRADTSLCMRMQWTPRSVSVAVDDAQTALADAIRKMSDARNEMQALAARAGWSQDRFDAEWNTATAVS